MAMPAESNLIWGWLAESLTDLDKPTGTTKSNPGTTGDPSLQGTGDDTYALFDAATGDGDCVLFTPDDPLFNVGTGDFTLVFRGRVTSEIDDAIFMDIWSGTNSEGFRLQLISDASNLIRLGRSGSMSFDMGYGTYVEDQDFIFVAKRTSGTCQLFFADDAGQMSEVTPLSQDDLGPIDFDQATQVAFGATITGSTPLNQRIYYALGFDVAIADADITTEANWTKTAIRSEYFGGGGGGEADPVTHSRRVIIRR